MTRTKTIEEGKIPAMIQTAARYAAYVENNCTEAKPERIDYHLAVLYRTLKQQFPQLETKEQCGNCDASMIAYWYSISITDASFMVKLGNEVKQRLIEKPGTPLQEVNRLHVVRLQQLTDAERHRETICRVLGLLAKVKRPDGKHDSGLWCITARGFAFLRDEPVPARVKAFRNEIIQRTTEEDTITLSQIKMQAKVIPEALEKWDRLALLGVTGERQQGTML